MGYTHYMYELKAGAFTREKAKMIIANAPCALAGGLGKGEPVVSAVKGVWLNGAGKGEYETFYLPPETTNNKEFNFCKTARKPYDAVVTAILIAALQDPANKGKKFGSDGYFEDWEPAMLLYQRAIGPIPATTIRRLKETLGTRPD